MKKRMTAFLCALALILTMIPASAPTAEAAAPSQTLYVGYGLQNVTPTMSVPLAGYGSTSKRMSEYNASDITNSHLLDDNGDDVVDANDGVYAACVAVKDSDGEILIFFGMDLIGANEDWVSAARTGIVETLAEQGIAVKKNNISVTVSHTHSSPDLSSSLDIIDTYRDTILVPGMVAAAEQAVADFKPVTDISKVTVKTENMNFVRHYEHSNSADFSTIVGYDGDNYSTGANGTYTRNTSQADPNIYMLKFERDGGLPVVMANWTAHPKCNSTGETAWGKINRLKVSSDYVGTFRTDLAKAGYLVAFFQGAAGNINTFSKLHVYNSKYSNPTNPATMMSVSGTNKNENYNGGTVTDTCQTSVLYGRVLANYAKEGLTATSNTATVTLESLQGGKIKAQQRYFSATTERGDPEAYEALSQTVPGTTQTYFEYLYDHFSSSHELVQKYDIKSKYHVSAIKRRVELAFDGYQLELNTYQIGDDISIGTAPNELFDTYCTDLREQGTFVFGYSNQSMGYLPDIDGIEKYYCYEANTTNYVAGTGEGVAKTLKEMMMPPEELGLSSTCHLCGATNVEWQILNGTSNNGTYSEWIDITKITDGHYYMIHDLYGAQLKGGVRTYTYQKTVTGNVCLDMRGHKIGSVSTPTGRTILVEKGANLRIANGTVVGQGFGSTASSFNGGVMTVANGATATVKNVTIQREVKENKTVDKGGAVYVAGTLNLLDSKVADGVATTQGGGIYVTSAGKLNIGGNTLVVGNTLEDGTVNNIYLETASTAGNNLQILNNFSGSVGITLPSYSQNTVFGTCPNPYTHAGFLSLDGRDDFVGYDSGKLTITDTCPYCGQTDVTWEEFPGPGAGGSDLDIPSGHYYLADDRTGSGNWNRRIKGDVCLNLNGHTFANESLTTGTPFYVLSGNTLNVFGGGVIQGQGYKTANNGSDSQYQGGALRVDSGATANLYNITVQRAVNGTQSSKWGGVIYAGGNVTLNGTKVLGGVATVNGDGIYVAKTGKLTLNGNAYVEENIYIDTTDDTTGSRFEVTDAYNGSATVELPAYTDGLIFGTCGTGTGTVALAVDSAVYKIFDGNMTVKVLKDVCKIIYADGSESEPYDFVDDALTDYVYDAPNPAYIQLLDDIEGTVTISESVYLDTNGFDVTVAIEGEGKLYGMENATNDFAVGNDDLGKITVESGSVLYDTDITINDVRYRYLPLEESAGVFTYHRFELNTKKGLRPYNVDYGTALYYQPFFTTDEAVAAVLNAAGTTADFGVMITPDETTNGTSELVSMKDCDIAFDEKAQTGGYRVVVPGLIPSNTEITNGEKTIANDDHSLVDVTGQAYIKLTSASGEDYYIYDDADAHISLRDAILKTDSDAVYDTLNKTQKDALNTMYSRYSKTINSWGKDLLNNIGNIKIDISDWFN